MTGGNFVLSFVTEGEPARVAAEPALVMVTVVSFEQRLRSRLLRWLQTALPAGGHVAEDGEGVSGRAQVRIDPVVAVLGHSTLQNVLARSPGVASLGA